MVSEPEQMAAQQLQWARQVVHADDAAPPVLRRIGGLDVHWTDDFRGVACLAVLSWPGLQLLDTHCHAFVADRPYEPGFLGFREVPAYQVVWAAAQAAGQKPDLVLVDGFGVCHPRGCGSASHFGVAAGTRAIGVGKTLNDVPVLRDREVKERMSAEGLTELQLSDAHGKVVATAVLKDAGHRQPVFVSVGHRVSLATAVDIVRRCCVYKNPEPVRIADIASRQWAEKMAAAAAPAAAGNSPTTSAQPEATAAAAAAAAVEAAAAAAQGQRLTAVSPLEPEPTT